MKRTRWAATGFEDWGGYMEAKKSKLTEQFKEEATKEGLKIDNLFEGVSIFVNGYTEPSADELRILMMKHGGEYHHYHRSGKTTHIIASNLPDSKLKQFQNAKVVKPEWITGSISAGKVLNYKEFLLITNQSTSQPALQFPGPSRPMKNAAQDGFLKEFYTNSRLHHISTTGSMFKEYVKELRARPNHVLTGRNELIGRGNSSDSIEAKQQVIMQIDMDCFFVSVGIRDKPHLVGKPVAVTHSKGNAAGPREGTNRIKEMELYAGRVELPPDHWSRLSDQDSMAEIASCSYEARRAGIKNGMFVGQALKRCPDLKFIPYDFEAYTQVSFTLYDTIAKYTLDIEAVSCDELYADCTQLLHASHLSPMEFATILRNEIKDKTKCPCSIGFGANKLQARVAMKKAKPNGQFHLEESDVPSVFYDLPIGDIPGVGWMMTRKMKELGLNTCGDLQSLPLAQLQSDFGAKIGLMLFNSCRGTDTKGLDFDHIRKSVSADVNYGIRFQNETERDGFLKNLSEEVSQRLQSIKMKGRSVSLKMMIRSKDAPEETAKFMGHGVCDSTTKTKTLPVATADSSIILREVMKMMKAQNVVTKDIRGLGIQISRLEQGPVVGNKLTDFLLAVKKSDSPKKTNSTTSDFVPCKPPPIPSTSAPAPSTPTKIEKKSQPSLKNSISPDNLRILVKRWVESENMPKKRDTAIITEYLDQLIIEHRLESVHLILKTFYWCVKRYDKPNLEKWKKTYTDIVNSVQRTMTDVFKSKLKLEYF